MSRDFDVIIIGAGAAGMMCAARSAALGMRVLLIDHAKKLAEKIRISGGGRCNFTNLQTEWTRYVSANPRFCRYALQEYKPTDFLKLVNEYGIRWHEKHKGQLFCDESSELIIEMLRNECDRYGVQWQMPCSVEQLHWRESSYEVVTAAGKYTAASVVIATGGMAIPAIGATDFGLQIARQFGHKIIEPRPALVPLTFDSEQWQAFSDLSGVALEADISAGQSKKAQTFNEDVLFTHRGLSGPGILQISSYWQLGEDIKLCLVSGDFESELLQRKEGSRQKLLTVLQDILPKRLAQTWLSSFYPQLPEYLAEISNKDLRKLTEHLRSWLLTPKGTVGYKKAEAMRGGVDTRELDPKTMQSKKQPGLYFVGEVVDITGWLGGYNFQWAWSSAVVCAQGLAQSQKTE